MPQWNQIISGSNYIYYVVEYIIKKFMEIFSHSVPNCIYFLIIIIWQIKGFSFMNFVSSQNVHQIFALHKHKLWKKQRKYFIRVIPKWIIIIIWLIKGFSFMNFVSSQNMHQIFAVHKCHMYVFHELEVSQHVCKEISIKQIFRTKFL